MQIPLLKEFTVNCFIQPPEVTAEISIAQKPKPIKFYWPVFGTFKKGTFPTLYVSLQSLDLKWSVNQANVSAELSFVNY